MTDIAQLWQKLKPHAVRDLLVSGVGGGGASGGGLSAHALNGPYHTGILAESQAPWAVTTSAFSAHTSNPNAHHSRQHDILSGSDHTATGGAALDVIGLSAPGALARLTPSSAPGATSAILKSSTAGELVLPALISASSGTAGGAIMQGILDLETSYARAFFGHNARWNGTSNLWTMDAIGANDASGLLLRNTAAAIDFIFHSSTGNTSRTMDHATFTGGTKFTMTSAGRLGILNTAPAHELDVTGTARATTSVITPLLTTATNVDLLINPGGTGAVQFPNNKKLRTSSFDSAFPIQGWQINEVAGIPGKSALTIGSISADELFIKYFVADETRIRRGTQYWTYSNGIVNRDFTTPSAIGGTVRVYFENSPAITGAIFVNNDWLMFQYIDNSGGGFTSTFVWGQVSSYINEGNGEQSWLFTLRQGLTNTALRKGTEAIDFGASGAALIQLSVVDVAGSPYIKMRRWTGSNPYTPANHKTYVQLGDLGSIGNSYYTPAGDGIYIGSTAGDERFLVADDNGLQIRGAAFKMYNSTLQTVDIGATNGSVKLGTDVSSNATTSFDFNGSTGDLTITGDLYTADVYLTRAEGILLNTGTTDDYVSGYSTKSIQWFSDITNPTGNALVTLAGSKATNDVYANLSAYSLSGIAKVRLIADSDVASTTDSQMYLRSQTGGNSIIYMFSDTISLQGVNGVTSSALSVNGNITVSGLVDGVDIAAFKTAYDSHNHNSLYLALTGGTLTGTLTSRTVAPSANNAYDLGSSTNYYNRAYIRNLYTDTIVGTPSYAHSHAAADIVSGVLDFARIPTTWTGALTLDADSVGTQNYLRWTTQTSPLKAWEMVARAHDHATSAQQNDLLLQFFDGTAFYTAFHADSITRVIDFGQTPTVGGTAVSLAGHTHDDRYFTESESDARYVQPAALGSYVAKVGDTMTGDLAIVASQPSFIAQIGSPTPSVYAEFAATSWSQAVNFFANIAYTNIGDPITNMIFKIDAGAHASGGGLFRFQGNGAFRGWEYYSSGVSAGAGAPVSLTRLAILSQSAVSLSARGSLTDFYMLPSGDVGIGTSAPHLKFEVLGTAGYPATSGATQTGIVRIRGGFANVLDIGQANASPWGVWLQASNNTNLTTTYPILLNPNGGNVGIGTTNPTRRLAVAGDMSASGVIYAGNDIEITGELLAANGTVGAPSIAATGDTNTGLYWSAADTLAITTGGAQRAAFSATGLAVTGSVSLTGTITGSLGLWSITNIGVGSFSALTTTAGVSAPQITAAANLLLAPTTDVLLDPGSNLVKLTSGVALQSDNYVSQTTGLRLTYDGQIDAGYVSVKELHAKAFIADLQMALAGGQIITPSVAELYSNFTCPAYSASATLTVRDLPSAAGMQVFPNGTMVRVASINRSGGTMTITAAFGTVTLDTSYGISGFDSATKTQRFTFARPAALFGGGMAAGTTVAPDAIILCYGVSGSGYIETTAVDGLYGANSPYIQIATWVGSPGLATVRSRWGNLNGLSIADYGLVMGSDVGLSSTRTFDFRASTGNLALGANGGAIMLQGDGSSYFSGPMTIGTSGGIYQGSGTFGTPTTGLKIWNDSGTGRIGGYNAGALQWYANTDGKLYAGAGAVKLDSNGITLTAGTGEANKITWYNGATKYFEQYGYTTGATYRTILNAVSPSTGTPSEMYLYAQTTGAADNTHVIIKPGLVQVMEASFNVAYSASVAGDLTVETDIHLVGGDIDGITALVPDSTVIGLLLDGKTKIAGDLEVTGNITGAWSSLTLTSGWGNYGAPYASAAHRSFGNLVLLRGLVVATGGSPSTHIATLPSGQRPANQMICTCMTIGGAKRVDVKTNGDIVPTGWTPALNDWISLENIMFYTN